MIDYFWLIGAGWVGVFGGVYYWFALTRERNSQTFTKEQAFRYSRNYTLAIVIPSIILWIIQSTLTEQASPMFNYWPSPQKEIAVSIVVICWLLLIAWVNLWGGAKIASSVFKATNPNFPSFLTSEVSVRIISVVIVLAGSLSMWLS